MFFHGGRLKIFNGALSTFLDPRLRFSFLKLTLEKGRCLKLLGWWGNLPEIYLALKRRWKPKRGTRLEPMEVPST